MTVGMSASRETLLCLALASRLPGLPGELERTEPSKREHMLKNKLIHPLPPAFEQDTLYGQLLEALFTYRLNRVEFQLVDWAVRGYAAVFLKKDAEESTSEKSEPEESLLGETALLWETIRDNARLSLHIALLGKAWDARTVRRGARLLRLHFTSHLAALLRRDVCSLLGQECIAMSLERIDWPRLAARVRDIPYTPIPPLLHENEESEDPVVQLALLKEAIWSGYNAFGEFGLQPTFSEELRVLCTILADHCFQTHDAACALEKACEASM